MYKLLLGLGVIDLAFQFPHLTVLCLVGVFLYQQLTEEDKQQIMTIYSNGKEFSKYLIDKAKELGITLPELRKQVVVNLEVPEPSNTDSLKSKLTDYIGDNLVDKLETNQNLFEYVAAQLASFIPEYLASENNNTTNTWYDNCCLMDYFFSKGVFGEPPEELTYNLTLQYRDKLNELKINFNAPYTYKIHRTVKSKLKAQGRNNLNEVIDDDLQEINDCLIESLETFFRGEISSPIEAKQWRLSSPNYQTLDINKLDYLHEVKHES